MQKLKRYSWLLLVVLLVIVIFYFQKPAGVEDDQVVTMGTEDGEMVNKNEEPSQEVIKVDVKGEVSRPGVYPMPNGSRVNDVIEAAGGMKASADPASVNLALRLQDEMVIHVTSTQVHDLLDTTTSSLVEKISINQASVSEIETLNGIGPSKAAAIVTYREENGPFSSVEDLVDVPGIGEKTLENLREDIRVP